jgi:uncharacterized protein (TIGR03083 family)
MTAPTTARAIEPLKLPLTCGIDRGVAMRLAATEYDRFLAQLRLLSPTDWGRPTRCPDWDVRAMAGHVLGMADMAASIVESWRQMRAAKQRGGVFIDALTGVQVDKHRELTPANLVDRFAVVGPKAARARRRTPSLIRRRTMPDEQPVSPEQSELWTLGFLLDMCLTRDTWMHRVDIADAIGVDLQLTSDHDGALVADVAAEWARRHGEPCSLMLTGPAGGSWTWGSGGPSLELDAVEFCRLLSGRGAADGLLATRVPF